MFLFRQRAPDEPNRGDGDEGEGGEGLGSG
jgi:hypothetical protein